MILFEQIKAALVSILNKLNSKNGSSYSPEYVQSQNHPHQKLKEAMGKAKASKNPF